MRKNAFRDVPHTVRRHFHLNFYAAIYHLIDYIRHLSEVGGESLDDIFERYPFLSEYFAQMLRYLPQKITWHRALAWWEREITFWEQASPKDLPLVTLAEQNEITFPHRMALMMVGLVEEDSRFGTLFAKLQEPLAYRRPSLEIVGQIMAAPLEGELDAWQLCQPLVAAGLIEATNKEAPRVEWLLRTPTMLWDVIRGASFAQAVLEVDKNASGLHYHPADSFSLVKELIVPDPFLTRLAQLPALIQGGKAQAIILRATPGSDRLQIMGAVARALGQNVLTVDASICLGQALGALGQAARRTEGVWKQVGPFCAMTRSLPVITIDMGPGETTDLPPLMGYKGPVGVLMGQEGGLKGPAVEKAVTLTLPHLKMSQRMAYWQEALGGHPVEKLSEISERFHLPGAYIRQAASMAIAHAALEQRDVINMEDVRQATRALNRQMLDTLATRLQVEANDALPAEGSWKRLVVSEVTASKLHELERRACNREKLLDYLAPAFGSGRNRGVRALFSGASGTGKTLAAKILSAQLGMDLYRVDLAAVVNKYIGETEKNLHQVLSRAEELDVILLLDEGDALLGSRTSVKSANDRYANLETDYLLQRLEQYQGIVVVTTNASENIDSAFQRRMDVVVNFIRPQAQERLQIWQLHLPANHVVDDTYLKEVATRCPITGGQIRNAALHATLLALDEGTPINRSHLAQAIQSEYRKAGAICPLNTNTRIPEQRGMAAFFDAFSS